MHGEYCNALRLGYRGCVLHGPGMFALILHRQKESYMIFIPSADMRHNLMWCRPTKNSKKSRSRHCNQSMEEILSTNATELENSCSVLKKHD